MTTFYQPMRRESTNRWDYTSRTNSRPPHPIGYCGGWREETPEELAEMSRRLGADLIESMKAERAKSEPFREKYHCDGHETADEAIACFDTYLLDQRLEFQVYPDMQRRCCVCGAWCMKRARIRGELVGGDHWCCDAHANRESYEPVFRARHTEVTR